MIKSAQRTCTAPNTIFLNLDKNELCQGIDAENQHYFEAPEARNKLKGKITGVTVTYAFEHEYLSIYCIYLNVRLYLMYNRIYINIYVLQNKVHIHRIFRNGWIVST